MVNTGAQQWEWSFQRGYRRSKMALCVVNMFEPSRHYITILVGKWYLELRDAFLLQLRIQHWNIFITLKYTNLSSAPNDIRYHRYDIANKAEYPSISSSEPWR